LIRRGKELALLIAAIVRDRRGSKLARLSLLLIFGVLGLSLISLFLFLVPVAAQFFLTLTGGAIEVWGNRSTLLTLAPGMSTSLPVSNRGLGILSSSPSLIAFAHRLRSSPSLVAARAWPFPSGRI
jgi:hypothetical protein